MRNKVPRAWMRDVYERDVTTGIDDEFVDLGDGRDVQRDEFVV
jgi:hypothetical protein